MFFINKKKKEIQIEETNYWLSIGDLMASILMIFMLLFIVKTIETGQELRKKEEIIEGFTGLKKNIISKIQKDFEERGIKVDLDPQTGTIKIDDKILFNTGEYLLKPEGKKYLNEFVPIYINLLLNDEQVKKELSQIIIEGHTDDVGSYIYNMELSQKRAFEVIKYIYDEMPNFKGKEELKRYITANGRSNIKVLRDNSGNIDRDKSRRVEFQFKLKEDETLMKIEKTLKEGN
ncbi:OmpA family protein [Fusobacterium animalis]|nr:MULTISPECIES: OmpA family protein [Fusobacterium]ASG30105.1 OmpA family protein [Fusobacterium animalis]